MVRLALTLPMEEIETNAKLIDGYTRKMRQLDGLEDGGKALIQEVRLVSIHAIYLTCIGR